MANARVRLTKRVKIGDVWRFCPVVKDSKGRYRLTLVTLPDGQEATVERLAGSYHLDYREVGTRNCPTVLKVLSNAGRIGITPENLTLKEVTDAVGIIERRLMGIKYGDIKVEPSKKALKVKAALADSIVSWIADRTPSVGNVSGEVTLAKNTLDLYSHVLKDFSGFCLSNGREYLEEITPTDVKMFYGYMASRPNRRSLTGFGLSDNSRNTMITVVSTFLRTIGRAEILETSNGVRRVPTVKRARSEETDIEDFSDEQIEGIFAAANQEERELFEFFLGTGMRAGEVVVAEWSDLKPQQGVVQVHKKTVKLGTGKEVYWFPKYKKDREIPISQSLFALLKARKHRISASNLIFPSENEDVESTFLRILKALGRRAGLECGQCRGCQVRKRTHKGGCEEFYLHRWRHTFACRHLRGNPDGTGKFDVKTVSTWLGHRSIATTERYLHAARGKEVQQKLNAGPMSRPLPTSQI